MTRKQKQLVNDLHHIVSYLGLDYWNVEQYRRKTRTTHLQCGFRGKPATIPESFRPPFRNDFGHYSGVNPDTDSDLKPATLSRGSGG